MGVGEFLSPDGKLVALFLVMAALSVVSLGADYRLIPCRLTAPGEGGQMMDSACSLSMLMGSRVGSSASMTPLSYIVLFLLVVAVPYLIACLVRAVAFRGA